MEGVRKNIGVEKASSGPVRRPGADAESNNVSRHELLDHPLSLASASTPPRALSPASHSSLHSQRRAWVMLLVTFATTVYWNGGKLGSSTVCKAWGSS